ncbi:MAG: nucleotide exchange factor GrpE [Planctomycetes bacterium]|nr:nucleotide exchange factor GrpE [Planctomycetota bacterium]
MLDDLQRALSLAAAGRGDDALAPGVRLVEERLLCALADQGVTPVEALGRPFDPRWHEAILEDERNDVEPGTITEELTRGYRIADRLLRAAVVRVARAPASAQSGGLPADPERREDADPERPGDAETLSGD